VRGLIPVHTKSQGRAAVPAERELVNEALQMGFGIGLEAVSDPALQDGAEGHDGLAIGPAILADVLAGRNDRLILLRELAAKSAADEVVIGFQDASTSRRNDVIFVIRHLQDE